MRRTLIPLAAAALVATAAAPAQALDVGISDESASSLQDARVSGLGLKYARLIVPWDAATSEPATVRAWLDAAEADGMEPHVAFEHLLHQKCPSRNCYAPSVAQYAAAVRAFIARFPDITTYTTWNEANHDSQPTSASPTLVASYYDELRAACPSCTIVAADVIDSGTFVQYLERFRRTAGGDPQLYGLHNYTDVTFGTTSGTDSALAAVPGRLWIEETGGIVVRRDGTGHELLRYDETRAANAVAQAFAIAATRPRITRMYFYQWRATASDYFDAGLVRPDGTTRPSYSAFVAGLRGLGLGSTASTTKATKTTWTARWSSAHRRTLVIRARCGAASCKGSVAPALRTLMRTTHSTRTRRLGTRRYALTSAHPLKTIRVRVSKALAHRARAALRRSLVLTVRDAGAGARTVILTLAKPS